MMNETTATMIKSRAFTDRMFRRLFLPALFSAIGWALGDVADALFVGIRLGRVGLATMSLVAPVYMIYNVLDGGIAIGTAVKYAHALGKGDARKGVNIFSQMTMLAVTVSVLVGIIGLAGMPYILRFLGAGPERSALWEYTRQYLQIMFLGTPLTFLYFLLYYCVRSDDNEKLASIGYTIGYLTDVAASAVFIMVLKLDVRGAIYATVLGKFVGVCIFMLHFTRRWTILRFRFAKPDFKLIASILKTGMSSSFGYIGQFIALLVINKILLRIGGSGALAQLNVVQDVSYLALAIYTALGDTVQPLSATFYAEHNRTSIKRTMALGIQIGIVSGGVIAAAFAVFAPSVCRLFGLTGGSVSAGAFAVRIFCLSVIPAGLNIIWSSGFQAIKREKTVFLINQLRTCICFLLFAVVLSQLGVKWFWFSFLGAEVLSIMIWAPLTHRKKKTDEDNVFNYLLDVNQSDFSDMLAQTEAFCEKNNASPKQVYFIMMCIEEVCQAIIENAFRKTGKEYVQLTVCFEKDGGIILHFRDNAVNFNPFAMKMGKDYDNPEHLASLGIQMVMKKSKEFFYRRYADFNTLTVEVE